METAHDLQQTLEQIEDGAEDEDEDEIDEDGEDQEDEWFYETDLSIIIRV